MNVVDLFCGCGGMSLGFSKAGYNIMAGIDNWDKAIDTYTMNFSHPAIMADLKNVCTATEIISTYNPDMIIGGPPCQDFSSAGKRNENNGRGDLTISYAQIISSIKPEWFVMENVSRIIKTQKLDEAKKILREAGYGMTQYILDASLCGVPQTRKRFFLIGKKRERDGFLLPFIEKNLANEPMSIKDYFGDEIELNYYYRHPRSYARRGIFSVHEPSPTIRGVNRPMPKGYKLHSGDPVDSLEGIRELTTEERSRIQTFPSSFIFSGNKTEREQMIGNAVPVNLAYFVGISILEYILFHKRNTIQVSLPDMDSDYWKSDAVQQSLFDEHPRYMIKGTAVMTCPESSVRWITEQKKFCIPMNYLEDTFDIKRLLLYNERKSVVGFYEIGAVRTLSKDELIKSGTPISLFESYCQPKYCIVDLQPLTDILY